MKGFDEKLQELEEITSRLRDPDTSLEDAAGAFERGMKLSRTLEKELEKMQRKVEILINQPDEPEDKPELSLFEGSDETQGT